MKKRWEKKMLSLKKYSWAELSRATRLSRWCIHLFARRPANLCNSNKADSTYEICAVQGTKTRADLTLTYGTHWVLPGSKLRSKPLPAPTNHGSPLSSSRYQDPSDGKPSSESIWISQTTVEMFSDVAKCKWIWWTCFWHFLTASHFSSVHLARTHVWTGNVTRFNVAMDASKSPMRFFTRARMKRKWGWFLTVYRTSRCSFYSDIKFISLVQKWKMVWPQRTPATSGPNRFGLASLPETTKCIQMCCQNFHTSSLSGLASSYWSKEMWDFASKYLPLGSWWNHFKLLYFWIQAIGI